MCYNDNVVEYDRCSNIYPPVRQLKEVWEVQNNGRKVNPVVRNKNIERN